MKRIILSIEINTNFRRPKLMAKEMGSVSNIVREGVSVSQFCMIL